MNLDFLQVLLPMLIRGIKVTFMIAVSGILLGLVIGCVCGFILQSQNRILKFIAGIYIWVIRATPLMVQALYMYYVVPKFFGFNWSANTVGIVVIALNSGAFISEIIKGALASIDPGQNEAAASLGLSKLQTMIHVIIPPAFKIALPGLFNQFIISVKDTALLSCIAVGEATHEAQNYAALSFKAIPTYTVLALFYLAILSVLILLQRRIESKMR